MKVYLATSGVYDDYRIQAAFTRREDAEALEIADDVEEFELRDRPAEVRTWYQIRWYRDLPLGEGIPGRRNANPLLSDRDRLIFDGNAGRVEVEKGGVRGAGAGRQIVVKGWDLELVKAKLDSLMTTHDQGR